MHELSRGRNNMICNYTYNVEHPTVFLSYDDKFKHDIDLDIIRNCNCWFMLIDNVTESDLPFLKELIKICNDNVYNYIAFMGENLSENVIRSIELCAKENITFGLPHLMFSTSIATYSTLSPQSYVGVFLIQNNKLVAQAINRGNLCYEEFSKLVNYAHRISSEIDNMKLNDVEKIIYIDNWFQKNIQYIKNKVTKDSLGREYYCDEINKEATASDVFINNYGTCEDITASIATILRQLKIKCNEIHADGHAWLIVNLENENYIWDCTYNITRNPNITENGIKATKYSYEYTLIGRDCNHHTPNELIPQIAEKSFSRDKLYYAIEKLCKTGIKFEYNNVARYNSCLIEGDFNNDESIY